MRWNGKHDFRTRIISVILSAAMMLTGGGYDQVAFAAQKVIVDGSQKTQQYQVFTDSTCKSSRFKAVYFTSDFGAHGTIKPFTAKDISNEAYKRIESSAYLKLVTQKYVDGTVGAYTTEFCIGSAPNDGKGNIKSGFPSAGFEITDGVFAREITVQFSGGISFVVEDTDNDHFFDVVSRTTDNSQQLKDAPAGTDGQDVKIFVSSYTTEKISLNSSGGSCDEKELSFDFGKTITELPEAQRDGYEFAGWYKSQGGMKDGVVTEDMINGSTRVKSGDVYKGGYKTLYAGWRPHHYKVTFDANGGAGSMTEQEFTVGQPGNLTANTFTAEGFMFDKWTTAADGSGIAYKDTDEIQDLSKEDGGSVTLYAQWKPQEYTITYSANGGEGSTDDTAMVYGTKDAGGMISKSGFSRSGYDMDGWNTDPNGTGVSYKEGEILTKWETRATTVLYAQWKDHEYTIRYDSNTDGVTPPADSTGCKYSRSYDLRSGKSMENPGHTFSGWNTKKDGTGTSYSDGQIVSGLTPEEDGIVTLYAQWDSNTYTVVFDPNGGDLTEKKTTADTRQAFTVGVSQQLKENVFHKKGYVFAGWKLVGVGTKYRDKAEFSSDVITGGIANGAEIHMEAQWAPRSYKVTQVMGSGELTYTKSQDAVYDIEGTLFTKGDDPFADYALQMQDSTFLGWSTKRNATVAQYPDGASFINLATGEEGNAEITLYGVWKKNPSSIACFYVYEDENGKYPTDRSGYGIITGTEGSYVDYKDGLRPETDIYEFDYCAAYPDAKEDPKTVIATGENIEKTVQLTGNNAQNGANAQHLVYYYKRKAFTVTFKNGTGVKDYTNISIANVELTGDRKDELVKKNDDGDITVKVPFGSRLTFKASVSNGYDLTSSAFSDASGGLANCLVSSMTGADASAFWSLTMPDHDIAIKADAVPKMYDISFVINKPEGAEEIYGSMPQMCDLAYDNDYHLYGCDYLIKGYDFAGWNTKADGSGDSYSDKANISKLCDFTDGSTVTLYAQWRPREYCVTFYTESDGSRYQTQLYAQRNGELHQAKGGSVAVTSIDKPVKAGYIFQGYAFSPEGTNMVVTVDNATGETKFVAGNNGVGSLAATDDLSADRALFAVWKPVKYKIAFSEGVGTASSHMESIDTEAGREVVLPPCVYTRTGYDFAGWSTGILGGAGEKSFADMAVVKNICGSDKDGSTVTLYAQWTPHKYTIRFNGNGIGYREDDDDVYEITAEYGKKIDLPLNTFKSGSSYLVFKGWNTDATLDYAIYGNGSSVKNLSEYDGDVVNLYAVWGYDETAKYAVRTWQQTVSGAHTLRTFLSALGDQEYGIDWGSIYNQKNYAVKETMVLETRDSKFTLPEYDGFNASYRAEPVGADGIVYYDYYYDRNEYSLKVDGGASVASGGSIASGSAASAETYFYGEMVQLKAYVPDEKYFGGWEVVSGDFTLKNSQKYNPSAKISMPASNVVIKALSSDVEIEIPTEDPKDPGNGSAGSGVIKNLGDETIPDEGVKISASIDYRLIPDGVTLISAKSSNPAVAYVDAEGNLILGKAGTAVITLETSEGTYIYTIHMTGVNGILEAGDVSDKYVKSVASVIKNGEVITIPVSERVPVISNGTIGKSTSTNPKVAYVGEDGYLVFGEDGEAIITTETSQGTIVYKVVIKDGKITIQSWKDENAENPSGTTTPAPVKTDAPNITENPSGTTTPAPDNTNAPAGTEGQTGNNPAAPGTAVTNTGTTETMTVGGLTYKVAGKQAVVTKASASAKRVTVKNKIRIGGKDYVVKGVAAGAFKNCKKLIGVKFTNTSISIGKNAFKGCKKLKKISFVKAKNVKISASAFAGCKKITFKTAKNRRAALKKAVKRSGFKKYIVK